MINIISFILAYLLTGVILIRLVFPWLIIWYAKRAKKQNGISDSVYDMHTSDWHDQVEQSDKMMPTRTKFLNIIQIYLLWPYELPRRAVKVLNLYLQHLYWWENRDL